MTDSISARLRQKANITNLGESVAWGTETVLMDEAADHIDAQDATINALVEALENARLHHYAALCVVRGNLDDRYSAMVDEMQAACDRWDAAIDAAKETT